MATTPDICDSRVSFVPTQADFCNVAGNADLYGLGIRLGTYLIWASSVLATTFATNTAESIRNLNACFQGATLVALIYITASRQTAVYQPQVESSVFGFEVYILLVLCFGGILSSTWTPQNTSLKQWRASIVNGAATPAELVRLAIAAASSAYGVWFSTAGLNDFCQSICGNYVFFFAKVGLYSWFRDFLTAMFAISTVVFAGFFVWSLFTTCRHLRTRWRSWTISKPSDQQVETVLGLVPLVYGVVIIILGVMAVEFPLFWNGVVGASSCSSLAQLLPIVIGAACLCRTCLNVGVDLTRDSTLAATKTQ